MLDLLPLLEQRPRPLRMRLLLLLLLRLLRLVAEARHHGKVLVLRDMKEFVISWLKYAGCMQKGSQMQFS